MNNSYNIYKLICEPCTCQVVKNKLTAGEYKCERCRKLQELLENEKRK